MILFNKTRCYNGGNKHKFEARYDEVPRDISKIDITAYSLRECMYYNIYVKDICVWCGKEIKK